MFVAYPLLGLDHIGTELQNRFSTSSLSHLPLDQLCATIERNVIGLAADERALAGPCARA